jgi:hypothetical protein
MENFGLTPEILARDQNLPRIPVQKFASKFPKKYPPPPQERHIIRGRNLRSIVVQQVIALKKSLKPHLNGKKSLQNKINHNIWQVATPRGLFWVRITVSQFCILFLVVASQKTFFGKNGKSFLQCLKFYLLMVFIMPKCTSVEILGALSCRDP